MKYAILLVWISILALSCGNNSSTETEIGEKVVDPTGRVMEYPEDYLTLDLVDLNVSGFDALVLKMNAKVIVAKGDDQRVRINIQKKYRELINTKVRGRKWVIECENPKLTIPKTIINVTTKGLNNIKVFSNGTVIVGKNVMAKNMDLEVDGDGSIKGMGFDLKSLKLKQSGLGEIQLVGTVADVDAEVNEDGKLFLSQLTAERMSLNHNSTRVVMANVKENLKVNLNSSGSVKYIGSPTINQSGNGSGTLTQLKK